MSDETIRTILTVLCSGGFLAFLQFLITRFDNKHDKFKVLEKKIDEGLEAREKAGKARYDEHHFSIEKLSVEYQKSFQDLQKAITQLAENDTNFAKSIEKMADKQDVMASANVGMVHNTIIRFTDPIIERGAVTYEELATLDSLYIPYSKLGGNGECKRRYQDVNKFDKISKEEAIKRDREIEAERFKEMQKAISS